MRLKRPRYRTILVGSIIVLCIAVGSTSIIIMVRNAHSIVNAQVLDQTNFTIFYPTGVEKNPTDWVLQKALNSYDKESGVLTLVATQTGSHQKIIISEQSTPDVFTDIPTQYSKMLNSLNEYSELQTSFGAVALTRPKELNGGQTAVINKAGTLIFAKPSSNLTDSEWRQFFDSLHILR